MSYDIDNASVLDAHDNIFETHQAGAFKHFVIVITPVEFTHGISVSKRVPFVNRLEILTSAVSHMVCRLYASFRMGWGWGGLRRETTG